MEIRAMDLIDKEDQGKRVKIVTRFLIEPNEPERTTANAACFKM